ncbi:ATP-binding protein [Herbiconiux sp. CPCC 203407]|uniref:ATP-binding protein n=1 Tax=Herbiconiux oxytropis TaxID=2970915 RepID=A0AA41XGF9_9MICO|nr:ATP-binding protein [Herbiconiux oxytropis]MCS5722505.1 ATP-binding protein [Herbiconiux oxytropis]MCS5727562.1 ATP-binding protein [Herbiconiux oxytropis]
MRNAAPGDIGLLTTAIAEETVPAVRGLLEAAARQAQQTPAPAVGDQPQEAPASPDILDALSGLIRHETEPIIGWIRRSAAKEIGDRYEASETFKNIDLLRRRLLGLETLAAAHRLPRYSRTSLLNLIVDCQPEGFPEQVVEANTGDDDSIDTDPGLFAIVVGNALLNAQEASAGLPGAPILVRHGVSDRQFWVTVTNRFQGQAFEMEHVAQTGASTKDSHKGLGVTAMRMAADRLRYSFTLQASGGTVVFSLRGERFRA